MSLSNLQLYLFISVNDSPLIFALIAEADLVEYDEYFSISIPAFPSMTFVPRANNRTCGDCLMWFLLANNKLIRDS